MSRSPSPEEARRAVEEVAAPVPELWADPLPLTVAGNVPSFPIDALPNWGGAMVSAVSEETQTPPDLAGIVFLGALSAATGGHAMVEVQTSWIEPVNLYAAPAMAPGTRKSAVFRIMTAPILRAERALQDQVRSDIHESQVSLEVAQEAAKRAVLEAVKKGTDDAQAAAIAAKELANSITVPAWPRMIADDVTAEALSSLLAQHCGRIAVLSAEGDLFDIMSGRYSSSGQVPNLGVFLKGHAGDLLLVDRKGREPERIEQPALTIVVCIQPQVLADIARRPVLRGRGLLARVLYSLPPDIVGYRRIDPMPVPQEVTDTYTSKCSALVKSLAGWDDPAVLPLTRQARKALARYQEEIEPRLRFGIGDLAALRDWASKLAGAAVRIAGNLHLAEHLTNGWDRPIAVETMERAIQLGDYFTEHARAAFEAMGADPLVADAQAVLAWIERAAVEEFSKRDAWQALRGPRFRKAADLDAPLDLLADHGHIQLSKPAATMPTGGRPSSPRYAVNPAVLDGSHNPHNPRTKKDSDDTATGPWRAPEPPQRPEPPCP
jgi:hypothetical protein